MANVMQISLCTHVAFLSVFYGLISQNKFLTISNSSGNYYKSLLIERQNIITVLFQNIVRNQWKINGNRFIAELRHYWHIKMKHK